MNKPALRLLKTEELVNEQNITENTVASTSKPNNDGNIQNKQLTNNSYNSRQNSPKLEIVDTPSSEERVDFSKTDFSSVNGINLGIDGIPSRLSSFLASRFLIKEKRFLDLSPSNGNFAYDAFLRRVGGTIIDNNRYSLRVAVSKLANVGLTEVALRLQNINLRRPVSLENFKSYLKPFYDIDTYSELMNLKEELNRNPDNVNRFISIIVASLLHGTGSGCLSTYTSSFQALTPNEQNALNFKRGQSPDYRAIAPRILRKTALILRDNNGLNYLKTPKIDGFYLDDLRDLAPISSNSVNFSLIAPFLVYKKRMNWLKEWFLSNNKTPEFCLNSVSEISDSGIYEDPATYLNELFFELARVTERNGNLAVCLNFPVIADTQNRVYNTKNLILNVINTNLQRYWKVIKTIKPIEPVQSQETLVKATVLKSAVFKNDGLKSKDSGKSEIGAEWEVLVVKRL